MKLRMAFCSCCKIQSVDQQPVWSSIQAERPDVLVLLGDNVYLDHDHHVDGGKLAAELAARYAQQFAEPNFARLVAEMTNGGGKQLFAIYDDHDFLGNNRYGGDHDPTLREHARQALVSAFKPRRTGNDVYSATSIGDLLLIVLDGRFYRTSPAFSRSHRDAFLGPAQWAWLEATLAGTQAKYIVIISGTTFHDFGSECWEQYPAAFERLRAQIAGRPGVMVLSGDIHRNDAYDDSGVLELVSSGVSRRGIVFGGLRENFALLDFDAAGVDVDMRGRKHRDRMKFWISLSNWSL